MKVFQLRQKNNTTASRIECKNINSNKNTELNRKQGGNEELKARH